MSVCFAAASALPSVSGVFVSALIGDVLQQESGPLSQSFAEWRVISASGGGPRLAQSMASPPSLLGRVLSNAAGRCPSHAGLVAYVLELFSHLIPLSADSRGRQRSLHAHFGRPDAGGISSIEICTSHNCSQSRLLDECGSQPVENTDSESSTCASRSTCACPLPSFSRVSDLLPNMLFSMPKRDKDRLLSGG